MSDTAPPSSQPVRRFRLFMPILAGATLGERLVACLGALVGIALTAALSAALVGADPLLPLIVAPMGASAVLVFAVPASPLAQPWPLVGGNTISAIVGLGVAHWVHQPVLAVALAVALAIAAMSFTRSLHPPGGAAALTAALGGSVVADWGLLFPLVPVALNSVILLAMGLAFHRISGRAYPHRPVMANTHKTADPPPQERVGFRPEDVDAALARVGETFDIDRADLDRLLREVELQSAIRGRARLRCADIMSRDVVTISQDASASEARRLLVDHNIRTLPVVDVERRVKGTVGLRELVRSDDSLSVSPALTAMPDDPALSLVPMLTDGRSHAVVIVDREGRLAGLITQTDLLAAAIRPDA